MWIATTHQFGVLNVGSRNDTLIDSPSPLNLNDTHLENATLVGVMSSSDSSMLMYTFEGISESLAETNAEAVRPSIESAVGVSLFVPDATQTVDTEVQVNYTGPGQSNMANFVNSMVSQCIDPSVDGFSDAIQSLATQTTTSALLLTATKESGGFDWMIGIGGGCNSTIPTGPNSHTIDVLDLLGVSSLAPSPYSFNATLDYYQSIVWLSFDCDPAVTFESCEPPEKQNPYDMSERGWTRVFFNAFHFGNDSSSVEALTFTFGGTVIPEFTQPAIIIALKKRMLWKNRS